MESEISFERVLKQLTELTALASNAGSALDAMEATGKKSTSAQVRMFRNLVGQIDKLESNTRALVGANTELSGIFQQVRANASKVFTGFYSENLKATASANALTRDLQGLGKVMNDTSAKQNFVKWTQKSNTVMADMRNQTRYLEVQLKALNSAEGEQLGQMKALVAGRQAELQVGQKYANQAAILKAQLEALSSGQALQVEQLKADVKERREAIKGMTRQAQATRELTQEVQSNNAAINAQRQAAMSQINLARQQMEAASNARSIEAQRAAAMREMAATQQKVSYGLGVITKAEAAFTAEQRRAKSAVDALNNSLIQQAAQKQRAMLAGRGGYSADLGAATTTALSSKNTREVNAQLQQMAAYGQKATLSLSALGAQEAKLAGEEARLARVIQQRNAYTDAAYNTANRLSESEARLQAQTEALQKSTRDYNNSLLEQQRALFGLSTAQKEQAERYAREEKRLASLRAEVQFLSSERGKSLAALQGQIGQQQAYNKLLSKSTAELLGFSSAQSKANASLALGSQATAAYRASLAGLQSTFGMFTSSTILIASAAYGAASAIRATISTGIEFTSTLSRVSAIMDRTGMSAQTFAGQVSAVEGQIRSVAQSSVFTATQAAEGMQQLVMAGMSATDAMMALEPALNLAAIANIGMSEAADISTNVLTQFGLKASDLKDVIDVMATAVTNSNTTMEQMANALTYVGPAAESAGYQLKDMTAAIEALANAGIKSSKAGTGLRRLLMSLNAPTKDGQEVLDKYRISVTNMDGSTRDLVDVMGQLNRAMNGEGVTASQRMADVTKLVGVYASSATAALIQNADAMRLYRAELDNVSGAAERMAKEALDNLGGDLKMTASAMEEVFLKAFMQVAPILRTAALEVTNFLTRLEEGDIKTFVANLQNIVETGKELVLLFASLKGISIVSGVLAGAGKSGADLAGRFGILSQRAGAMAASVKVSDQALQALTLQQSASAKQAVATGAAQSGLRGTFEALNNKLKANTTLTTANIGVQKASAAAMTAGATSARVLATAVATAGTAFKVLGTVASIASPILAIGSAIYFAYQALRTFYSSDTEKKIEQQNELIESAREKYERLNEELERYNERKNYDTLTKSLEMAGDRIDELREQIDGYKQTIADFASQGLDTSSLETGLELTEKRMKAQQELEKSLQGELDKSKEVGGAQQSAALDQNKLVQQRVRILADLESSQKRLAELQEDNRHSAIGVNTEMVGLVTTVANLQAALSGVNSQLQQIGVSTNNVVNSIANYRQGIRDATNEIFLDALEKSDQPIYRQLAENEAKQRKMVQDLLAKDPNADAVAQLKAEDGKYQALVKQGVKLRAKQAEIERNSLKLKNDISTVGSRDSLTAMTAELDKLVQQRKELTLLNDGYATEETNNLLQQEEQLRSRIFQLQKSGSKESHKSVKQLEKQEDLLADIARLYTDYDYEAGVTDRQLQAQKDLNSLLYDANLSAEKQATLINRYAASYGNVEAMVQRVAERSEEVRKVEAEVAKYTEQMASTSGTARVNAEERVNDRLKRQKKLVADQLKDYQELTRAQADRNKELLNTLGDQQKAVQLRKLIEEAADQGRYLSESEAERLQNIKLLNIEQASQNRLLEDARSTLVQMEANGASQGELQAQRELVRYTQMHVDLLDDVIKGTVNATDKLSIQAQTTKNLADAVSSYFDQASEDIISALGKGKDGIDDIFKAIGQSFTDLLSAMAREALINPIMIGIKNDVMSATGLNGGGPAGPGIKDGWGVVSKTLGLKDGIGSINWMGAPTSYSGGFAGNATSGMGVASNGSSWFGGSTSNFSGFNGLASAGAGYAGSMVGTKVGSSLFGKEAGSNYGAMAGGAIGTYFGGPIGSFAGSALGGMLDSAFGSSREPFVKTWTGGLNEEPEKWWHDYHAKTALGNVGILDKQKLDPEPLREWVQTIETVDNRIASMLNDSQLERARSHVSHVYNYKGTDLEKVAENRYNAVLNGIVDGSDDFTSELLERLGRIQSDTFEEQMGQLSKILQVGKLVEDLGAPVRDYANELVNADTNMDDMLATLQNGIEVFNGFKAMAKDLNLTFDDTATGAVQATLQLAELAGGISNLEQMAKSYSDTYFTEHEKQQKLIAEITPTLKANNLSLDSTLYQFRQRVEALDQNTESGRRAFVELMKVNEAFAKLKDNAGASAEQMNAARLDRVRTAYGNLQKSIEAERDIANKAYESTVETLRSNIDKISESMKAAEQASNALQGALDAMFGTDVTQQSYASAQNYLRSVRDSGGLGDEKKLSDALSTISQPTQDLYSSFVDYQRGLYQTSNLVSELKDRADGQLESQEDAVSALQRQIRAAEDQHNREMARFDSILAQQARMIEAEYGAQSWLEQINSSVLTIPEALSALGVAMKGNDSQFTGSLNDRFQQASAKYLNDNPDVAAAVKNGTFKSAYEHYLKHGQYESNRGGFPAFASGGEHEGGYRIVGEEGPELEYTGPSRIYSNRDSSRMLDFQGIISELQKARQDSEYFRKALYTIAKNTGQTAKVLKAWNVDGTPETREVDA